MTSPTPFREYTYRPDGSAPESKLDQLIALYDEAKDAADAAAERLKTVTDAMKAELTSSYADASGPYEAYHLVSASLRKPLHLRWVVANRFDTARFRAAYPELANDYTKPQGSWRLERDRK